VVIEVDENGDIVRVRGKEGSWRITEHHPLDIPDFYGEPSGVYRPHNPNAGEVPDGATLQPETEANNPDIRDDMGLPDYNPQDEDDEEAAAPADLRDNSNFLD